MQIERLLDITFYLLDKRSVTASELAGRFGVSKRTVYRDIDALSLSGIPIYTSKGNGGGIKVMDGFILNKSMLSEREQKEILSALRVLLTVKTDETDHTLKKLEAFFSRAAPDWFEVDFTRWGPDSGEAFASIKTAIFENRVLKFDYYSAYGEKTRRRVIPHKLWFKSHSWYLKGFCLEKNASRLFKLTRIRDIVVTDEVFDERRLADERKQAGEGGLAGECKLADKYGDERGGERRLADERGDERNDERGDDPYNDDAAAGQPGPAAGAPGAPGARTLKSITVILKIAPEMTYKVYDDFIDNQIEKNGDGSFLVTIDEFEDERLYGYILSYGEHAVVVSPEYAKRIIKEKAERIFTAYT